LPSPDLQRYIKCYQFRHFVFSGDVQLPFKPYPPRAEQTLTFYPRDHEYVEYVSAGTIVKRPRAMLMGQYTERTNRHLGGPNFIVFIVEFRPGVLYRITGIPFDDLTNTFVDAECVFSSEMRRVNERLGSATEYEDMIFIVETFLRRLLQSVKRDAHPLDRVTDLLIQCPENFSIDRLADAACLSPRQLERNFRQRMGITPKLFTRIARINKACRMKYTYPNQDWLSVALACGYHDHQHLVKDFKDFAGVAPTAFFLQDQKAPETFFGLPDSSMLM